MSESSIEDAILTACVAGKRDRAATLILEAYGPELFRFIASRVRDRNAAEDVFAAFSETLWRGLVGFRRECSARSWAYTLARHSASRYIRSARSRKRYEAPLSRAEAASRIPAPQELSADTLAEAALAELRAELTADDRALLLLRVERRLDFRNIACFLGGGKRGVDAADLDREAARLRKRFQLLKDRLRKLAIERGFVPR